MFELPLETDTSGCTYTAHLRVREPVDRNQLSMNRQYSNCGFVDSQHFQYGHFSLSYPLPTQYHPSDTNQSHGGPLHTLRVGYHLHLLSQTNSRITASQLFVPWS
jgi:hypothetical protein